MISFKKALEKILKNTHWLQPISVKLSESLGYALAEKIVANEPIPRFDMSAVDGYAVLASDLQDVSKRKPKTLPIDGTVKAGDTIIPILRKGYTIKISTGAPVPRNANAIVMKEHVRKLKNKVSFSKKIKKGENIRYRAEEFKKGDILLKRGILITPPVVGILASLGHTNVHVHRKPRVGLIITGDELRNPKSKLKLGEIYDSNTLAISAALHSLGIDIHTASCTKDNKQSIRLALTQAIRTSDVVISAGGVSVGDFDFVKEVFLNLGVKRIFWKVATKPGKPLFFGTLGKKLVFGLPGNPVAAMVSFHQFVIPALVKIMGIRDKKPSHLTVKTTTNLEKYTDRLEFIRGKLSINSKGELCVTPTRGQESHMLGGLVNANCLIHFPKSEKRIEKGKKVTVSMLNWSML